jgi:hypothetical protein
MVTVRMLTPMPLAVGHLLDEDQRLASARADRYDGYSRPRDGAGSDEEKKIGDPVHHGTQIASR